jgi:hypothetical protein
MCKGCTRDAALPALGYDAPQKVRRPARPVLVPSPPVPSRV